MIILIIKTVLLYTFLIKLEYTIQVNFKNILSRLRCKRKNEFASYLNGLFASRHFVFILLHDVVFL